MREECVLVFFPLMAQMRARSAPDRRRLHADGLIESAPRSGQAAHDRPDRRMQRLCGFHIREAVHTNEPQQCSLVRRQLSKALREFEKC